MLVVLQFSKENEQTIKDLLHSVKLDFKLFCSGSLEVVAESLMERCSNCKEKVTSEECKENENMWILFILNKKNDNLMLNLLNTCLIIVKTFQNVRSFFDSERLQCRICIGKKCNKTVDPIKEERIKREPQDETVEKEKKPVNLGPRLVEIALIKASGIVVKEEKDIKNEEDSDSPKTKRARIEMTEPEDVNKQEQLDKTIEQNVETGVYLEPIPLDIETERNETPENESSELDSNDSDFFTENRKRKKFSKKSLESSECKKRSVQQHMNRHNDVSLNRDDPFEEQRDNNEERENSNSNSDDSNQETASSSLGKKKNFKSKASNECPHCGRPCGSKSILEIHLFTHTGERPYQCQECDKTYTQINHLNRHVKAFHRGEKPFDCDVCEMKFAQKCTLIVHRRTHDGERPFECLECDSRFTQSSSLNTHVKAAHRGLKPYECDICEKKFSKMFNLNDHRRIHTGEKPFHCDLCEKKFGDKRNLIIHQMKHHGQNK